MNKEQAKELLLSIMNGENCNLVNEVSEMFNPVKIKRKMRLIKEVAKDIAHNWTNVCPYAKPYLQAMLHLNKITDKYYLDDASSVIRYFLANANTYRGEMARKHKAELKEILASASCS
jgi:hypothetical protein